MRYELWVNVRIAIFFGTVDICQIYRCVITVRRTVMAGPDLITPLSL